MQRAADGRQRRRDDGLLQRGEEHGEQNADHDRADGGVGERDRWLRRVHGPAGWKMPETAGIARAASAALSCRTNLQTSQLHSNQYTHSLSAAESEPKADHGSRANRYVDLSSGRQSNAPTRTESKRYASVE